MSAAYADFIARKRARMAPSGFEPKLKPMAAMKPFQWALTRRAVQLGRSAIFADCGLGKTIMQLEWARQVTGRVIIFTPLAVGLQTEREANKFGYEAKFCHEKAAKDTKVIITNYESQHKFDPADFNAVVLDESSILKNFDGRTRRTLNERWRLPYRLCCTATPAPNDFIELGCHSEFLGQMSYQEMQSMFFINDGNQTQKYRLKGHAVDRFWDWVSTWASFASNPSDIGFCGADYVLPPLHMIEHSVKTEGPADGFLFKMPVCSLSERIDARKQSVTERARMLGSICASDDHQWLVWCALNSEADRASEIIPGAVNLTGSDTDTQKERKLMGFIDGGIRVLVTKPKIAGFGMNFQQCHNMAFLGLNDSYETLYQAVRRCWRFGQEKEVNAHIITSDVEHAVSQNIKRKTAAAESLARELAVRTKEQLHG